MKFYAIDSCARGDATNSPDVYSKDMYHGDARRCGHPRPFPDREFYPTPFRGTAEPLELVRSCVDVPDVFQPATSLVVSDRVRQQLATFDGIEVREVGIAKLIDWRYEPDRDRLEFARRLFDGGDVFDFYPAVDRAIGSYFELICPVPEEIGDCCGSDELQSIVIDADDEPVGLCESMFARWPVIWWSFNLVREDVYRVLEPNMNPDFFIVTEHVV